MIVVDQVSKYYGAHRAVADLSFEIAAGECVGLLGLNGAGKSTTLRLLACLSLPTSGSIRVRGLDVVENPHEIRKLIGYLPDTPPLYGEMTVDEFLAHAGALRGLSGADLDKRRKRVLAQCSLLDVSGVTIGTLSHGYRQRVGIAQAIIHGPALVILDEPIQGLDPVQIVEMRKLIAELRGEHTILLSTHILTEIERTCDRILMMHNGRIAAVGTEQELEARMRSTHKLELVVRGEAPALRAALAAVPGASELRLEEPEADNLDGVLRATLRVESADVAEAVSRAIVTAGLGLLALHPVRSGLENVFLELSGAALPQTIPPSAGASAS
jgi:ABC-2 type transport system ATP-binding protein